MSSVSSFIPLGRRLHGVNQWSRYVELVLTNVSADTQSFQAVRRFFGNIEIGELAKVFWDNLDKLSIMLMQPLLSTSDDTPTVSSLGGYRLDVHQSRDASKFFLH